MNDIKRLEMRISGRVQGVFYRKEAQKIAKQNTLVGFIRNESDGSVTCVAEGEESKLRNLLDWCKVGPDRAEVKMVEVEWKFPTNSFTSFEITY